MLQINMQFISRKRKNKFFYHLTDHRNSQNHTTITTLLKKVTLLPFHFHYESFFSEIIFCSHFRESEFMQILNIKILTQSLLKCTDCRPQNQSKNFIIMAFFPKKKKKKGCQYKSVGKKWQIFALVTNIFYRQKFLTTKFYTDGFLYSFFLDYSIVHENKNVFTNFFKR